MSTNSIIMEHCDLLPPHSGARWTCRSSAVIVRRKRLAISRIVCAPKASSLIQAKRCATASPATSVQPKQKVDFIAEHFSCLLRMHSPSFLPLASVKKTKALLLKHHHFHSLWAFSGLSGTPPNCECPIQYQLDDIHWICRPWYLKPTIPTTRRPIYTPAPVRYRCPEHSLNPDAYVPYCRFNYTVSFSAHLAHSINMLLAKQLLARRNNRSRWPILFVRRFALFQKVNIARMA